MNFFTCHVQEKGIASNLEDFIFSPKANLGTEAQLAVDKQPQMLNRLLTGVLHPMIHTGYGAEFNLLGMIVEGKTGSHPALTLKDSLVPVIVFSTRSRSNRCSPCFC